MEDDRETSARSDADSVSIRLPDDELPDEEMEDEEAR
jgi:hypothetical protein